MRRTTLIYNYQISNTNHLWFLQHPQCFHYTHIFENQDFQPCTEISNREEIERSLCRDAQSELSCLCNFSQIQIEGQHRHRVRPFRSNESQPNLTFSSALPPDRVLWHFLLVVSLCFFSFSFSLFVFLMFFL